MTLIQSSTELYFCCVIVFMNVSCRSSRSFGRKRRSARRSARSLAEGVYVYVWAPDRTIHQGYLAMHLKRKAPSTPLCKLPLSPPALPVVGGLVQFGHVPYANLLWLVFQRFFGICRPMNADDFLLELSAGIYGVQNMHLFKLKRFEILSSFWQIRQTR